MAFRHLLTSLNHVSVSPARLSLLTRVSNMHFLVIANDHTDAEALDRRLAARMKHLEGAKELHSKSTNSLHLGGAILDDQGKMVGSTLIYEAESIEKVKEIIANDPYTLNNVWDPNNIIIKQIKLADLKQ
ncbi:hypothetical protein H4219_000355 [Mycoemilia scoparia]|uniref:YCII-related domain-containing protein n=1 Tax=Mycoemilia scoparia TaxID=417184 RepID=A0A9W8A427_9FUNG|nr:hypothetical protein H4219_000355 [Mycoemilia scoparia]